MPTALVLWFFSCMPRILKLYPPSEPPEGLIKKKKKQISTHPAKRFDSVHLGWGPHLDLSNILR